MVVLPEPLTSMSFLPPLFAVAPNRPPLVVWVVVVVFVLPEFLMMFLPPLLALGL